MAAKIELTGGNFQDSEGNPLALGYFTMQLNQDGSVNDSQVCSGLIITITLDGSGNCNTGQYVWGNDAMSPANSYYKITVHAADGQIVWGPNNQQVTGSGTFDVGSWTPNSVISWTPPLQVPQIQVDGTPFTSPALINFTDTASVTWVDAGGGQLEATATVPPSGLLQPDTARYALWEAMPGYSNHFYQTNDANEFGAYSVATDNIATAAQGNFVQCDQGVWYGVFWAWPGRALTFKMALVMPTKPIGQNVYWGFTNLSQGSITGTDPTTADSLFVAIVAGQANWQLVCSNGGTVTTTDSGVAIFTSTRYAFKITLVSGVATLYINGTQACTANTHVPTSNTMYMTWWQRALAGTKGLANVEYLYGDNATP